MKKSRFLHSQRNNVQEFSWLTFKIRNLCIFKGDKDLNFNELETCPELVAIAAVTQFFIIATIGWMACEAGFERGVGTGPTDPAIFGAGF